MAGVKGRSGGKREGAGRKPTVFEPIPLENVEQVYKARQSNPNELVMPKEIKDFPEAKRAWEEIIEIDKTSKYPMLNVRHKETLKSICLAIATRERLVAQWKQDNYAAMLANDRGAKLHPIIAQLEKTSRTINEFAEDLGMTVPSEWDMVKKANGAETFNGEKKDSEEDDLFGDE